MSPFNFEVALLLNFVENSMLSSYWKLRLLLNFEENSTLSSYSKSPSYLRDESSLKNIYICLFSVKELSSLHDKHLHRPTMDDSVDEEHAIEIQTQQITQVYDTVQGDTKSLNCA